MYKFWNDGEEQIIYGELTDEKEGLYCCDNGMYYSHCEEVDLRSVFVVGIRSDNTGYCQLNAKTEEDVCKLLRITFRNFLDHSLRKSKLIELLAMEILNE